MSLIGRILKWIGTLTVLLVLLLIYVVLTFDDKLPERMVLEVDFRREIVEHTGDHPLALLRGSQRLDLREQLLTISRAGSDDRVVGLIGRIGSQRMSLAHVQELADVIRLFRESGKPCVAFAETIGGMTPANGSYLLSTAFDKIRLQPSGSVGLVGLSVEHPFLRGTLDSLGIQPVFGQREDYKLAPNMYTETAFTDRHREATLALLGDQFDQLVSGIADGRGVETDIVRAWIEEGPYMAKEALAAGLVDVLSYVDEAHGSFAVEHPDAERVKLSAYAREETSDSGSRIALIYGVGTIVSGPSRYGPVDESQTAGSDTVLEAFDKASADPDVRAILFRVDSPGGSYVASDAIWRATRLAQEKGIPVVVSMGSAAASGGYLVSSHADRVVAQPGTITGSIGVWAGKFVTSEFWSRLGISWDSVSIGSQARLSSSLADFSSEERKRFDEQLDRVYEAFVEQVAAGREMSAGQVQASARGRVWTGRQAQAQGLVDDLGGYATALDATRALLGLDAGADLSLVVYPKPKDLAERILQGDWESLSAELEPGIQQHLFGRLSSLRELLGGPAAWTPWLDGIRH